MAAGLSKKLEVLEEKLWAEFRAVPEFPEGVPEEVQLRLLEEYYRELRITGPDPEYAEIEAATGCQGRIVIDFCGGWCPDCQLLDWCPIPREDHTPEEIEWMKANNDYPPEV